MNTTSMVFIYKKPALVTGISLIVMALAAGFAYGFVFSSIYVPLDAVSSSQHLIQNFEFYYYGIIAWGIIILLDITVSIGIYYIYRNVQPRLAIWTSVLRIIYTMFLIFSIYQLSVPLFESSEIQNSLFYMVSFSKIWSYGLIIFGLHLIFLSILCFKSAFTPNVVATLLLIGGISYMLIESLKSFTPEFEAMTTTIESVLITPMVLSELTFAIWLIVRSSIQDKTEHK